MTLNGSGNKKKKTERMTNACLGKGPRKSIKKILTTTHAKLQKKYIKIISSFDWVCPLVKCNLLEYSKS